MFNFEKFSNEEIMGFVAECFETVEKVGVMDNKTNVCKVWLEFCENGNPYNISNFLDELYMEFAKRYNLHKSYRDYLKSAISQIDFGSVSSS